jgi:hypothetical protein
MIIGGFDAPSMARNGHANSSDECPVLRVERTCRADGGTSGFDPNRTCHAHGILAFDCSKIGPGVHQGLAAGSWERTFQMSGLEL